MENLIIIGAGGICLIGNSSSGIIEAPSLGIYTINIGNRQAGRVQGNSIINVECKRKNIENAIKEVIENHDKIKPINPYYKKNTSFTYYEITKKILCNLAEDIKEPKVFYDIKF